MRSRTIGCFSSQSVSPVVRVAQADGRGDVAGVDLLDLLALVGVHLEQAADALLACPWSTLQHVAPASSMPE